MENEIEAALDSLPIDIEHVAVVYGDGSAINGKGDYGSGCTGYLYRKESIGQKNSDVPNKYLITDIGYLETDELNKFKYQTVIPEFYIDGMFGYKDFGNSSRGELLAFIHSAKELLFTKDIRINLKKFIYKSDSTYTIGAIDAVMYKSEDEWRRTHVGNKDLIEEIFNLTKEFKKRNIELKTMKVLGHSVSLGNNLADRLAYLARLTKEYKFVITDAKKHWTRKLELNPLLKFRQLFFINNHNYANEKMYGIMDYSLKTEPGKKTHEAVYGVVLPKQPDELIEKAISIYSSYYQSLSILSTIDLAQLYSRNTTYYYSIFGDSVLYKNERNNTLCSIDNIPIIKGIYPSGLGVQAYGKLESLYNILQDYRNFKKDGKSDNKFIEITDSIYQRGGKKKFYTCTIKQDVTDLTYEVDKVKILVTLGKDTLNRNQFKAIEKQNPNIYLAVLKVGKFVQYQTIVDIPDGDLAIYTNLYSCRVFL